MHYWFSSVDDVGWACPNFSKLTFEHPSERAANAGNWVIKQKLQVVIVYGWCAGLAEVYSGQS